MADYFDPRERYQTFYAAPADTNAATIYTCPSSWATIRAIHIAANGASNVTVAINNGSDRHVLHTYALGANTYVTLNLGHPVLNNGDTVKVTTSNADDAFFTLTVGEGFDEG